MEKLVARAKKMQPADPLDPKTRMGAVVSEQQMKTVLGYIDAGKKEGAKLITGGSRASVDGSKGFFIEPTIFDNVKPQDRIAREEIFGPVLSILRAKDYEEAVGFANTSEYGLTSSIYTNDANRTEGRHGVD